MAVIKCSNCENEILDTEIVCPYCDCPISETIKKMKKDDLESYSSSSIDGLTEKIPSVVHDEEPKIATSADFAREKAAILRDLGIKVPGEDDVDASKNDDTAKDENISQSEETAPAQKTVDEVIVTETEPVKEEIPAPEVPKAETSKEEVSPAEATMGGTVKISRDSTLEKDALKKDTVPSDAKPASEKSDSAKRNTNSRQKTKKKKSAGKYVVLGITIIGIIVIIYLIMGIADTISVGINKNKKVNKTVTVVDSSAASDAQKGFEIHSSTLTITDDDVMKDYDSPQDTPWFEYRDKIKHVTFGKKITRIGAHAFEGFENITDINISNSVETIGESAFCNCVSLSKITNMSKNLKEIGDYAFTGCKSLNKIPGYTEDADFESTLEKIGVEAFKSCKSIEAFRVPESAKIDTDAFFGHGDEFVLICDTDSDAYIYATEKGIPTRTSFDSEEETNNVSGITVPQTNIQASASGTTKTETKKTETKKTEDDINKASSDKSDKDDKKSEAKDPDPVLESNGNGATTPSTSTPAVSTPPVAGTPSTGNSTSGSSGGAPVAGIAPSGSNNGGIVPQGGTVPPPTNNNADSQGGSVLPSSNPGQDSSVPQTGNTGGAATNPFVGAGQLTENFNNAQTEAQKSQARDAIANALH